MPFILFVLCFPTYEWAVLWAQCLCAHSAHEPNGVEFSLEIAWPIVLYQDMMTQLEKEASEDEESRTRLLVTGNMSTWTYQTGFASCPLSPSRHLHGPIGQVAEWRVASWS